ncbi:unnamed protein product [Protopolystoma xenopodis]|uniref:Uncharacterized protein n=1 Tax=Protopolystoma xenopodis TaxID=117903 RepID=A0A448WBB6_9PLAT|nr:unnamed protein product [Protopolystoma xenopodis]
MQIVLFFVHDRNHGQHAHLSSAKNPAQSTREPYHQPRLDFRAHGRHFGHHMFILICILLVFPVSLHPLFQHVAQASSPLLCSSSSFTYSFLLSSSTF